ncbi:hypothetical protein AB9M62_25415 [Bacillales bacterium AN1005]
MHIKKKVIGILTGVSLALLLTACGSTTKSSDKKPESLLEVNSTYEGVKGTKEIIQVNSDDTWTVKDKYKDDSNYNVNTLEKTDEKVDKYTVYKIVATEVNGDIRSALSKREGRKFIIVKDGEDIYLRTVSDENTEGITDKLVDAKNKDELLIDIANYSLSRIN